MLKLWRHAYETKVFRNRQEAIGRGPTPEAFQKAAEKRWLVEQSAEKNAVSRAAH
jgi:hypothetical protein